MNLSTSGFLAEITSVRFVLIVAGLMVLLAGILTLFNIKEHDTVFSS
ncbi:hypothetical protein Toce_2090 [Thermosediminibacter oceani DSM 16646]|uniref:Uncharacterized protein n=1 Tax=Thermosediminibacter oceani (strain ATCC BAA-1034 / DSM 16646 / JW/IW-1228P) TaxID=555079 RepID=D9S0E7_THEOJ|nr:hypothetical protein Toce_2090 [Thermosediminibacter oceani DSM 16646]